MIKNETENLTGTGTSDPFAETGNLLFYPFHHSTIRSRRNSHLHHAINQTSGWQCATFRNTQMSETPTDARVPGCCALSTSLILLIVLRPRGSLSAGRRV